MDDIMTFGNLKLISELSPLKDRIQSFEDKHGCSIAAFEARLRKLPEDFERWDDFIVEGLRRLLKRSRIKDHRYILLPP